MANILVILVSLCVVWNGVCVTAESEREATQRFCVCFESAKSNWKIGTEAGLCFGRGFLEKGKNTTCDPEIDEDLCKDQRLQNLALSYVTDLKTIDKYLGVSVSNIPDEGTVLDTNLKTMIRMYNRFFKYHPAAKAACKAFHWDKYEILTELSTFNDFKPEYPLNQALPNTVAMVKVLSLGYNLQKEVDRVCDEAPTSDYCVEMRQINRIIGKMRDLLENILSFSEGNKEEAMNAFKLNFVPFILKYPDWKRIQPSDEAERRRLYELFTNNLVTYTVNKDFKKLVFVMRFLPGYADMRDCNGYENGDYCIFKSSTDQLSQYLSKKKAKMEMRGKPQQRIYGLKSYIDYKTYMKTFWKQAVLEKLRSSKETFNLVRDFLVDEIRETTGKRINELKDYFYNVEGYNQRIASADMAYLEGMMKRARIAFYKEKTKVIELKDELEEKIREILHGTFWWNVLGMGFSLLTTGLDIRKWVQGNAIADLVETGNELLASGANLRELGALGETLVKTTRELKDIYSALIDNGHFLRLTRELLPSSELDVTSEEFNHAKTVFLQNYTDYSPKVRRSQITQAGEMFVSVIDQMCSKIDVAQGPYAHYKAGELQYDGKCFKLMSAMSTMTSYNEQLYEFQFEYMDAMAEYMRSSTGTFAAREINSKLFQRSTSSLSPTLMRSLAIGAFFTHEIQKWQIMEDYCDTLEYRNGGKRPAICQDLSTDFPSLVAYIPKECDSDVEQIVDIPIQEKTSGNKPDSSALYLKHLVEGMNVVFQVPNTDWLLKNKWITQVDAESAIYVKNFQIYIPAYHKKAMKVRSEVTAAINQLYPGGPIYGIRPPAVFVSEYDTGKADLGCRLPPLENPYTTCRLRRMPLICETTTTPNNADDFKTSTKYPSIFASWSIRVSGYESLKTVNYATPLAIKAKVQLCKIRNRIPRTSATKQPVEGGSDDISTRSDAEETPSTIWGCCYGRRFLNATSNECEDCPGNSKRGLLGYACIQGK